MDLWEQRYRAPIAGFPTWARHAPDRLVFASNESGAQQLHALDLATGERRQVTSVPIGISFGIATPGGESIVWFDDETGDEVGRWVVEPWSGGEAEPLVDTVPSAWSSGLAIGDRVVVVGTADPDGYTVWIGGRAVHHHTDVVDVADLSHDGTLVALAHAEHGDSVHLALRVLDTTTGESVGDLWDGEGLGLRAGEWAPVDGDRRLAIVSERAGLLRPGIWDLATGERRDLRLDLPGDVTVVDWWPDATALLLVHTFEARDRLLRHDLTTGETTGIDHPEGSITRAAVRPDGDVWYRLGTGATAPVTRSLGTGETVVAAAGDAPPAGFPFRSWHATNPSGDRVHGFVIEPPDLPRPHPLAVLVHGGPTAHWSDAWRPEVPAWVDQGFAVVLLNYRGSTGYGAAWRDVLVGNPGFPELEDTVAAVDALIAEGVADRGRVVLAGRSWGGYITLLGLGRHPDRWAAGVGVVPVADYPAAYADESPPLQSYDRMLFGGSPDDVPERYVERSPLTYVDDVRAPVLIVAGDNDTRCPIRQILNYVERLEARGHEHHFYRYDAGHGSMVLDEQVRQMREELEFVTARVGRD